MALSANLSEMQQPLQAVKVPCNLSNGSKEYGLLLRKKKQKSPKGPTRPFGANLQNKLCIPRCN